MNDILTVGGVEVNALTKTLGTPLIVYDEGALEKRLSEFKQSFFAPPALKRR